MPELHGPDFALRIALVDNPIFETSYGRSILNALAKNRRMRNSLVVCYVPSNFERNPTPQMLRVWSSHSFFIQIPLAAFRDKIDIVHFQFETNMFGGFSWTLLTPVCLLLIRILRKKVVVTHHAPIGLDQLQDQHFIMALPPPLRRLPVCLLRLSLPVFYFLMGRLSDANFVHSRGSVLTLTRDYLFPQAKVGIVPHGVENAIDYGNLPAWLAESNKTKRIILVPGRIAPRKDFITLINAYQKVSLILNDTLLVVVGKKSDPAIATHLEKSVVEKNLFDCCIIHYDVDDATLHALYEIAEVVLLPYLVALGASGPMTLAIQHLKPVIAPKVGWFATEFTDGVDIIHYELGNVDDLMDKIVSALTNKAETTRIVANLERLRSSWSWEKVADLTADLYFRVSEPETGRIYGDPS